MRRKTLRGGIEPPRHFRTTGFPGLRPTARLPQQKVYPICMPGIFLMVSLLMGPCCGSGTGFPVLFPVRSPLLLSRRFLSRRILWFFWLFFLFRKDLVGFCPAPGIGAGLQEDRSGSNDKACIARLEGCRRDQRLAETDKLVFL